MNSDPLGYLRSFVCIQETSVGDTERSVAETEDEEFFPEDLVDATFPPSQQLGEATESSVGHVQGIRHGHFVTCVRPTPLTVTEGLVTGF